MLRKSTQITGLLIAATSIISMVPAMAADYQNIEAEDGILYSASSKGGGIFVIDGEINGEDDRYIYLLKDGEYTKLDDAEPGDKIGDICQGKYLEMTENDGDVYYVDITTGKETDDYSREVENGDIARKLRKKIKKDNEGRFSDDNFTTSLVTPDTTVRGDGSGEETMWGISGKWRQSFYNLEKPFTVEQYNYNKNTSTIYSDDQGNYIDVDYNLGSISVTTTSSSVTIKNTDDTYQIKEDGTTYELRAQIKNTRTWDEGPEYIVRTAALTIWRKEKGAEDSAYENITNQVELGSKAHHYEQVTNDDNSVTVIQRISKDPASDDIDGIKYPKTVTTYFITDKDGNAQPLLALGNGADEIYTRMGVRVITGGTQGYNVSALYDFINKKTYAETINYKSKNGYNYIDIDDYDEANSDAFALGCGDVWTLGDRYVKRFNCKENKFEKLYKVDGGMTNFNPSLPTDVVLWNKEDECYSIISPKALTEEQKDILTTTTTEAAVTTAGWSKDNNGTWTYVKADRTKATGWFKDGAAWYYLRSDGIMSAGWVNDNGYWYYLNVSGAMQTGWINDNGTWYYCNESGTMLANTSVDGYVLGANGAWAK